MNKNTIIAFGVVVILLLTSTSAIAIDCAQQSGELKSITIQNTDNIDRWAVIVGISDYIGSDGDLIAPAPDSEYLYSLLQDKDSRWNANNMLLLLNEIATKQNILNALDWLKENTNEGDIILFSFNGHGSFVDDEPPFDELDRKDEVICPYDCYRDDNGLLHNYITDDVLGSKFDEISNKGVKGMFLILDSCLSGGLVNWINPGETINSVESLPVQETIGESNMIIQSSNIDTTGTLSTEGALTNEQILNILDQLPQESKSVTTGLNEIPSIEEIIGEWNAAVQEANSFTAGLTEDISTANKVVSACCLPHALGFEAKRYIDGTYFGYLAAISKAIEEGRTTAEDISQYAKSWWLSQPGVIVVWLNNFFPGPLLIEIVENLLNGHWMWWFLPIPMWKDGYPASDPSSAKLSIIGDSGGNSQSTPQSNPISQPSVQQSSTTQQSTTVSTTIKQTITAN